MKKLRTAIFALCLPALSVFAQNLTTAQASPKAMVMQQVGLTQITISYHSPSAGGRKIWGEVVPYGFDPSNAFGNGKPMPWRAGANENTTINFSTDVMVEGKALAAGTYGLHMIPGETKFTVIFNRNSTSWGSFFYEESEDALRIDVTPEIKNESKERLTYSFDDTKNNSTTMQLRWEKMRIPVKIEVDIAKTTMASIKLELRSGKGFDPKNMIQAASTCVRLNTNLEDALFWSERAILLGGGAPALLAKSSVLEKMGKTKESADAKKAAIEIANEADLNLYGYTLLGQKKTDEALEMFKLNVKRNPNSSNVYDSLGEALAEKGEKKQAIDNYSKALKLATDDGNRKRITEIIAKLSK